jgi:hypothetical protein
MRSLKGGEERSISIRGGKKGKKGKVEIGGKSQGKENRDRKVIVE